MCDEQVQLGPGKNACPDCGTVLQKQTPANGPPQPDPGDAGGPPNGPDDHDDSDDYIASDMGDAPDADDAGGAAPPQNGNAADEGTCPNCGRDVDADFAVCPYCQTSLSDVGGGTPENVCPDCGYDELQPGMQVCPMCAEPLDDSGGGAGDGAPGPGDDADPIDPAHPAATPGGGSPQPDDGDAPPTSLQLRFDAGPVMNADDGTSLGVEIRKKLNAAGVPRREAMRVSRRHVMFKRDADGFHVVDLESSNGTQLNGDRLEPNREYELSDGDTLEIAGVAEATVRL